MGLVLAIVSCLLFSFLCFCLLVCIICSKLCPCLSCCRSTSQKNSNLYYHVQVALQLSPPLWIKRLQPPERTTASSKLHFPPSYMEGQVLRDMEICYMVSREIYSSLAYFHLRWVWLNQFVTVYCVKKCSYLDGLAYLVHAFFCNFLIIAESVAKIKEKLKCWIDISKQKPPP